MTTLFIFWRGGVTRSSIIFFRFFFEAQNTAVFFRNGFALLSKQNIFDYPLSWKLHSTRTTQDPGNDPADLPGVFSAEPLYHLVQT
jgi:hypothetical protein